MKNNKIIFSVITIILMLAVMCVPAFAKESSTVESPVPTIGALEETEEKSAEEASEENGGSVLSAKAISAAAVVGVVATAGAIGMAFSIAKSTDGMARQPEAASKINSAMMLGLVFIETAIIYALIVAILIIFVL